MQTIKELAMQAAQNLIQQLGKHIGLDELDFDEGGQCTLAFDETIVLTFVGDQEDSLNLVSYVGDLNQANESAYKTLLSRNFVPNAFGGGRVAMEPDSSRIALVARWDAVRTDLQHFIAQLETFVNGVESLRVDLENGKPTLGTGSSRLNFDAPPPGAFA
jgi:hypothetical protein